MTKHATRRSAFISGLIGAVIGALLVTALPVSAGPGDNLKVGQINHSGGWVTRLKGKGNPTLRLINPNNRPALELRVEPGTPPLAVNRAAWVKNLNADLLDGRQAWDLTRATHGTIDGWALPGPGNGNVVAANITAPTAGLLVMSGSFDTTTIASPVYDFFDCYLKVDGAEVGGSRRKMEFQFDNTVSLHGDWGTLEQNCATDGVARVGPGSHSVALAIADNQLGMVADAVVWAIFVPFDGNGNVP